MNVLKSYIKLLFLQKKDKEFFYFVKHQLGYSPRNLYYYRKALTHKSAHIIDDEGTFICNERLEFLGDSILDSAISDYLFNKYKHKDEGFLTQMRSKLVNRKSLNDIALSLRLNKYIVSNGLSLTNNSAMGNAFEALIGAMYLDMGYGFTKKFIIDKILEKYYDLNFLEKNDSNFKSRLIELVQRTKATFSFDTIEDGINANGRPLFTSSVLVNDSIICSARGESKKDAEQNAAKIALQKLE